MKTLIRYAIQIATCFVIAHLIRITQWKVNIGRFQVNKLTASQVHQDRHQEVYLAVNEESANELKERVRVLCWVMTTPKNHWRKARHVKKTWGKRCNILLFMSSEKDDRIPTIKLPNLIEGYDNIWLKTREAFRYVHQHYRDQADWFLKADDDSYIVMENLRYFLSAYKTSDPYYFGHRYKAYLKNGYMQGGSGYVLSREALNRFVEIGLTDEKKCPSDRWPEDVQFGRCMDNLDCKGMDTRDSYGRDRFLPMTLEVHLSLGVSDSGIWFWDLHPSYYPIKKGFDCCSDTAIGFHQLTPSEMYLYNYFLYDLNPYGIDYIRSEIQAIPQPPPDLNLKAPPFPGPSEEDLRWSAAMKAREELKWMQIQRKDEKAQLLDNNDTMRIDAWNKKMKETP